jgi:exonuclease SbcC
MRPIRLELEGFTAYREYTVLDFDGADLFVLTGPTGSGKSSIIDAITFALYGSVPRYQNPNLVHPVISQGKVEAKVRFDFAIGERAFTAVRVVRKTPRGGATTKEARLESRGQLVAGTADEISRTMRELLGLNFEQFTTCVVLPQGDFARFLHEKPAQRQDLLTKLLGVDVYEKMGNLARTREAVSKQRAQLHQEELEGVRDATQAASRKVAARVKALAKLKEAIEKAEPEIDNLAKRVESKHAEAARLEAEAETLKRLEVPRGLAELAGKIEAARNDHDRARQKRTEADEALHEAEAARARLGDSAQLKQTLHAHETHAQRANELDAAKRAALAAKTRLEKQEAALSKSKARVASARASVDAARHKLAAHDLASHLKAGEPCPVCEQLVTDVPPLTLPPALSNAEKDFTEADETNKKVERDFREVEREATLADERARSLTRELAAIEAKLSGEPATIQAKLAEIDGSDGRLASWRKAERDARALEKRAHAAVTELSEEEARAWKRFEAARDAVAALSPPRTDRDALGEAWTALAEWAKGKSPEHLALAKKASTAAHAAVDAKSKLVDELQKKANELNITLPDARPRDAVVSLLAQAEQEQMRIAEAIERARTLKKKVETERESAAVAGALGLHLKSSGFERWLLEAAFRRLASGATAILNELSSGQYSFEYDDKLNFEVLDHRNADERRSARTLSGGETFLASLALALTLAEQTAELASEGSSRLESLFLDEGFGTLDDETLEIVANAIEDLGAKGRVVGLVTHQQSLADKIAVQFRVNKGPVTATVEKIIA